MPGPITSVPLEMPIGYSGQLHASFPYATDTKLSEGTIPAGRVVTIEGVAAEGYVKLPDTGTDLLNRKTGIAMWRPDKSEDSSDYVDDEPLTRVLTGRVWVRAEDACTEGGQAFVRFQAGDLGRIRSDSDGGNAAALTGSIFRSSTSVAEELVLVELNL